MAFLSSCYSPLKAHLFSLPSFFFPAKPCLTSLSPSGCLIGNPNKLQYPCVVADIKNTSLTTSNLKEDEVQVSDSPDVQTFQEEATAGGQNTKQKEDVNGNDEQKKIRVSDKLIEIFLVDKPTAADWRKLLTFSREWDNLRTHFYQRCQERADEEENPEMKHKLLRLGRKLKEIEQDVQRHNELLEVVRGAPSEINEVVAKRRKDFTEEFLVHVLTVAQSYYDKPEEADAVAKIGTMCVEAVQAYDMASENTEALNAAELKFQDILNSPTLDAACKKIDSLAEKNQLDSTLFLTMAKAWATAKESSLMKDEVKDMMYHMYMAARRNLQKLVPKEIRIVKYLLTIKDPKKKLAKLRDAFTPGPELELAGEDADSLYTTPQHLYAWIRTVVNAYHSSPAGTLLKEARDLMNPKTIQKMEELSMIIKDHFL